MDPSIRPLLAYWIRQEKQQERDVERAKEDVATWLRRAKLALAKNDVALATEARQHAIEARDKLRRAEVRLEMIKTERELVRESGRGARDEAFRAAERRANHAMQEFAKLGINAEFALLADEGAQMETEDTLSRLRRRMEADLRRSSAPASGEPSPAMPGRVAEQGPAEEAPNPNDTSLGFPHTSADRPPPPGRPSTGPVDRPAAVLSASMPEFVEIGGDPATTPPPPRLIDPPETTDAAPHEPQDGADDDPASPSREEDATGPKSPFFEDIGGEE